VKFCRFLPSSLDFFPQLLTLTNFRRPKLLPFLFRRKLAGKTLFITGASRGIGKAIALKAARDGANIVIAAKTTEPHPKLPGTIYTAAKEGKDFWFSGFSSHFIIL